MPNILKGAEGMGFLEFPLAAILRICRDIDEWARSRMCKTVTGECFSLALLTVK